MSNGKQPKVKKEARDFRRFIEESFPVKEVGEASAHERNRPGHINTLHIWWARRPLAASRATAYAALTPTPKDAEEWQKKRDFIIQLSQWENSNNQSLLERARREILEANGGVPPKVIDPFSGGGSYPLEALRLGCESYANDYNPVAVLIEKAMLEYPQKFGRPFEGMPEWAKPQSGNQKADSKKKKKSKDDQPALFEPIIDSESTDFNPLVNAVRYWSEWVLEEVRKELTEFYPNEADGSTQSSYIWAHAVPCQNPSCGLSIPLLKTLYIVDKAKQKIAIYPDKKNGKPFYRLVGDGYEPSPKGFDAEKGTTSRAKVACPFCGGVIDADTTRKLFQSGKSTKELLVVVLEKNGERGKKFRIKKESDMLIYQKARERFSVVRHEQMNKKGFDPLPDEPLKRVPVTFGVINVWLYGIDNWGKLFDDRQALALVTYLEKIHRVNELIIEETGLEEFSKAIVTYLAFVLDKLACFVSILTRWRSDTASLERVFDKQALPMIWDYGEANPIGTSKGVWDISSILEVITNLSSIYDNNVGSGKVSNSSATNLSFPDNYFDAVLTDPPYYDNVPYSYLSDYFYIWLKRSLGHLYPDLFSPPLSPKSGEIVAYFQGEEIDKESGKIYFEEGLKNAFKEIHRILKPNGISTIVYAHKSTSGWETIINALLDSDLVVTSAWPIITEMGTRARAQESATLGSSIYIIARKASRQPTGFYNDVRTELSQYLDSKLHRLWEEGVSGADFFIAAIGSAIEIFGKYEQIMDFEGNIVRANRLLEEVRVIATNYAVKQILHDDFATEVSPIARFYVLWRWNYGEALVPFDEANKLAHSCGLDLSLQFGKNGFIKKEKEFARLLGPQGRKLDDLDDPRDMIDVLHKSLLLWEKGQRAEMVKALSDRGFGKSEAFYRVAQAISETLPLESKEKKLLDGFLAGRDRVQQEVEKSTEQGKLL